MQSSSKLLAGVNIFRACTYLRTFTVFHRDRWFSQNLVLGRLSYDGVYSAVHRAWVADAQEEIHMAKFRVGSPRSQEISTRSVDGETQLIAMDIVLCQTGHCEREQRFFGS